MGKKPRPDLLGTAELLHVLEPDRENGRRQGLDPDRDRQWLSIHNGIRPSGGGLEGRTGPKTEEKIICAADFSLKVKRAVPCRPAGSRLRPRHGPMQGRGDPFNSVPGQTRRYTDGLFEKARTVGQLYVKHVVKRVVAQ